MMTSSNVEPYFPRAVVPGELRAFTRVRREGDRASGFIGVAALLPDRQRPSINRTIRRRCSEWGNGPRMAPALSVMWAGLLVRGITAVTRGSASKYFRKNCPQE